MNKLLSGTALAVALFSAGSAFAGDAITLGVTSKVDVLEERGAIVTLEIGSGGSVTSTSNIYGSLMVATGDVIVGEYNMTIRSTAITLGRSFATGTAFKPRVGLTFNRTEASAPAVNGVIHSRDDTGVGLDLGVLFAPAEGYVLTAGYNTDTKSANIGAGISW